MPQFLSDRQVNLLYEVYEITARETTVVAGGEGMSRLQVDLFGAGKSVRDHLEGAIIYINESDARVERVSEILEEWVELSLDLSKIDSDGYALRPSKNIRAIRDRLYPYTGIVFKSSPTSGNGNRACLG